MRIINNLEDKDICQLVKRPVMNQKTLSVIIENIFEEINRDGDKALKKLSEQYDKVTIKDTLVTQEEIDKAFDEMENDLKEAIYVAKENIEKYHKAQLRENFEIFTMDGVRCGQVMKAINKVGLYIPGGTAPLFSTLLMLAIPAAIAGCKEIIVCSPPTHQGSVASSILAVAKICGIKKIYRVGGAQAIAAMAIGTESIPKVDKIFGPGNQYVTAAKEYATQFHTAYDMPSGPSEVLVYADQSCIPAFVASDLLSQAEHGTDSQVVCVTSALSIAQAILDEVNNQVANLPRRNIALASLTNSFILVEESVDRAFEFINEYAAEHLIIASDDYKKYIDYIENAGSVFLGNYSPEAAGDYASGTNHALPTSSWAKSYAGVGVDSFLKRISFQTLNENGLKNLSKTIIRMAEAENLFAHANAVKIRLNQFKQ